MTRLVKVLSEKCAHRETVLAAQQGRPPRPIPTLDDVPAAPYPPPSKGRQKKKTTKEDSHEPRVDIEVDSQAYADYFGPQATQHESVLDDAQALLLLADPVTTTATTTTTTTTTAGSGSPFAVDDQEPGEGVGLEISAAAALAAAQAARQPLPFSRALKSTSTCSTSQRPALPRAATTSAVRGAGAGSMLPTLQTLPPLTAGGAPNADTAEVEAYRSAVPPPPMTFTPDALNVAMATPPDTSAEFDPAFVPVVESAESAHAAAAIATSGRDLWEHVPAPMYYLPLPVPSTDACGVPVSASAVAGATPSKQQPAAVTFFHPSLGPAAGQGRTLLGPDPSGWHTDREARHRERFDRAALEAQTTAVSAASTPRAGGGQVSPSESAQADGADRAALDDDADPMLLGPLGESHPDLLPQRLPLPPRRRSSWLLSPILAPLSLPVPPPQRPQLSVDAAGAFAHSARDVTFTNPLSGSTSGGGHGGSASGNGSAISTLFWRGLPSAIAPLRSAIAPLRSALAGAEEAELRPFGSRIRLWHEDGIVDSPCGLLYPGAVDDHPDYDGDDDNDERFEPRAARASSPLVARGLGFADEWARFQPRTANQTERADLTVVEESEPEEQPATRPEQVPQAAEAGAARTTTTTTSNNRSGEAAAKSPTRSATGETLSDLGAGRDGEAATDAGGQKSETAVEAGENKDGAV